MDIRISLDAVVSGDRSFVVFDAHVRERSVQCSIAREALEQYFNFRKGGDGCGQNAAKQVQFTNKFVQSVTLLPTPMTVFPRVALDSHFDIVQVFRLEEIAYFVENHRDMVGKLFIRERIAMFYFGIT
jgi:hypothetical protein